MPITVLTGCVAPFLSLSLSLFRNVRRHSGSGLRASSVHPGQSHHLTGAARWGRRVQHLLTCARLVYCRPCVSYFVARVASVYFAGNAETIQDPSPTKQPSTRADHAATVCGVARAEGDRTISADWSSQVPARVLAINDILSPRGLLQAFCT